MGTESSPGCWHGQASRLVPVGVGKLPQKRHREDGGGAAAGQSNGSVVHDYEVPKTASNLLNPLLTDMYQITMCYGYWKAGRHEIPSTFDMFFRSCPFKGEFCIFAGLTEAIAFLNEYKFTEEHIDYLRKQLPSAEAEFFDWLKYPPAHPLPPRRPASRDQHRSHVKTGPGSPGRRATPRPQRHFPGHHLTQPAPQRHPAATLSAYKDAPPDHRGFPRGPRQPAPRRGSRGGGASERRAGAKCHVGAGHARPAQPGGGSRGRSGSAADSEGPHGHRGLRGLVIMGRLTRSVPPWRRQAGAGGVACNAFCPRSAPWGMGRDKREGVARSSFLAGGGWGGGDASGGAGSQRCSSSCPRVAPPRTHAPWLGAGRACWSTGLVGTGHDGAGDGERVV